MASRSILRAFPIIYYAIVLSLTLLTLVVYSDPFYDREHLLVFGAWLVLFGLAVWYSANRRQRRKPIIVVTLALAILLTVAVAFLVPVRIRFLISKSQFDTLAQVSTSDTRSTTQPKTAGGWQIQQLQIEQPIGNVWLTVEIDELGYPRGFAYIMDMPPPASSSYQRLTGKWFIWREYK